MSIEGVYSLYNKLLELAGDQLNALQNDRFDDAFGYLEKRQIIIDKINKLDNAGIIGHVENDIGHDIRINIEKIQLIDTENLTFLKNELNSISQRLESIQKAKTFCSNAAYNQEGNTLNISA